MGDTAHTQDNPRRRVPSVDALLQQMPEEAARWGHRALTEALRAVLAQLRRQLGAGREPPADQGSIRSLVRQHLQTRDAATLKPVINLTGTVLHTNLGRASLPDAAVAALARVAGMPANLEFDLERGQRGERESHVADLICELTGAEAATVVNNNAAAVLLVLNTLARQRQVPVSRGELVEVGGSFRISEVMQRSACHLVEVGATNRTHLQDYRQAINADTALLLKVHTSNYRIEGFTQAVSEEQLAALAREHGLPFVIDLGSGNLLDFAALGLPAEPTAMQAIAAGADVITFSGDKLLGGPQTGLIAGRRDLLEQINRNPLKRALRLDKLNLAALAEVLKLYRRPERLLLELPTLRQLTRSLADIQSQARRLQPALSKTLGSDFEVSVQDCASQIGSGALPVATLPSAALHVLPRSGADAGIGGLAQKFRRFSWPVIGRLHKGALWLDLRCLEDEATFLEQIGTL